LHEANCGGRVTAYEHYQENYQRPAEGPAHDSLPAALRLSITHPPRYSDFMRGMHGLPDRWSYPNQQDLDLPRSHRVTARASFIAARQVV
jgi:hypothetical protein